MGRALQLQRWFQIVTKDLQRMIDQRHPQERLGEG